MRVALVQLSATPDPAVNRDAVGRLVAEAATSDPDLVVLPELWHVSGPAAALRAAAEPVDGPTSRWLAETAASVGRWIVGGSIAEARPDGTLANTCLVVDPEGRVRATYRKVHLFDCHVPGAELVESDTFSPGDGSVVVDVGGVAVGLAICFDLRFPELFTALAGAGAEVVVVPAAFTARTGRDHWELLLRARALDTQAFVVAADQCGATSGSLRWHGHSMAVDPWGTVLASAGTEEGVTVVDLDLAEVARVRGVLPVLANRREPEASAVGSHGSIEHAAGAARGAAWSPTGAP